MPSLFSRPLTMRNVVHPHVMRFSDNDIPVRRVAQRDAFQANVLRMIDGDELMTGVGIRLPSRMPRPRMRAPVTPTGPARCRDKGDLPLLAVDAFFTRAQCVVPAPPRCRPGRRSASSSPLSYRFHAGRDRSRPRSSPRSGISVSGSPMNRCSTSSSAPRRATLSDAVGGRCRKVMRPSAIPTMPARSGSTVAVVNDRVGRTVTVTDRPCRKWRRLSSDRFSCSSCRLPAELVEILNRTTGAICLP